MEDYIYNSRYINIENWERNRTNPKPNGSMHNWLLPQTRWVKVGLDLVLVQEWMESKRGGAQGLNPPGKAHDKTLHTHAIIDGVACTTARHWQHMGKLIEDRAGGWEPLRRNHRDIADIIIRQRECVGGDRAREYLEDRFERTMASAHP